MVSLLLTRIPGIGKTTIRRRVAASPAKCRFSGFITDEIHAERGREGFRLIIFKGQDATMAHVDFRSAHRVGKYRIPSFVGSETSVSFCKEVSIVFGSSQD